VSGAAPGVRRWSGLLAALCLLAPAGASPQTLNAQLSGDLAPTHIAVQEALGGKTWNGSSRSPTINTCPAPRQAER